MRFRLISEHGVLVPAPPRSRGERRWIHRPLRCASGPHVNVAEEDLDRLVNALATGS